MAVLPTGSDMDFVTVALGAIALLSSAGCYMLYGKLQNIKRYAEIVKVMSEAKNKPMGIVVDRAGKMVPFVIESNPKNRGLIEHSKYTLINPDLVSPKSRARFAGGPETLMYPLPGFFPFSIQSSAALVQLARKIREDPTLNWIPSELQVMSLTFNGTKTLYDDCRSVIISHLKFGDELPEQYTYQENYDGMSDVGYEGEDIE